MRDWTKAFLPASFRGVPFHVAEENQDAGRRISVQHGAYGEVPIVEDFGSLEDVHTVTAYVVSDAADAEGRALSRAFAAKGAARLVLPHEGGMLARVPSFRRSRDKDRNGYIAFDVDFVRAGGSPAFAPSFNAAGALRAFDTLTAAVTSALR